MRTVNFIVQPSARSLATLKIVFFFRRRRRRRSWRECQNHLFEVVWFLLEHKINKQIIFSHSLYPHPLCPSSSQTSARLLAEIHT